MVRQVTGSNGRVQAHAGSHQNSSSCVVLRPIVVVIFRLVGCLSNLCFVSEQHIEEAAPHSSRKLPCRRTVSYKHSANHICTGPCKCKYHNLSTSAVLDLHMSLGRRAIMSIELHGTACAPFALGCMSRTHGISQSQSACVGCALVFVCWQGLLCSSLECGAPLPSSTPGVCCGGRKVDMHQGCLL